MKPYHFLVLGTESRQDYLASLLTQKGHTVTAAPEYLPGKYNVLLLPIPQTDIYFEKILPRLEPGQLVFGCNFSQKHQTQAEELGVHVYDYMMPPGIASRNAIATAEGAIVEAILAAKRTIHGSHSLVFGYGNCGQVLATKLNALQSQVTVFDRSPEKQAAAVANGCSALSLSAQSDVWHSTLASADILFNTIPAPIIDKSILKQLPSHITIIDIASNPGGVDFSYCEKRRLNAKLCLGLPGKYAPKSAACILLEVMEEIIQEVFA